jgi:hypothetical protein
VLFAMLENGQLGFHHLCPSPCVIEAPLPFVDGLEMS